MKKVVLLLSVFCTMLFAAVDLNTASKVELMALKGIGETKALRIIEYRNNKAFTSIEELKNVKGFSNKLVNKLSKELEVSQK